jgi:hypothetical protein
MAMKLKYGGVKSSYNGHLSLRRKHLAFIFYLAIVVLPAVLDHLLKPLDPIQKHGDEHFSGDFSCHSAYCAFDGLAVREMDSLDLLF